MGQEQTQAADGAKLKDQELNELARQSAAESKEISKKTSEFSQKSVENNQLDAKIAEVSTEKDRLQKKLQKESTSTQKFMVQQKQQAASLNMKQKKKMEEYRSELELLERNGEQFQEMLRDQEKETKFLQKIGADASAAQSLRDTINKFFAEQRQLIERVKAFQDKEAEFIAMHKGSLLPTQEEKVQAIPDSVGQWQDEQVALMKHTQDAQDRLQELLDNN